MSEKNPHRGLKRYKWLADGSGIYSDFIYAPVGEWMKVKGELSMRERGFHVCRADQVAFWCGTELAEVEVRGERLDDDARDKECWREMRIVRLLKWNRKDMVAYARWCAKRAAFAADAAAFAAGAAKRAAFAAARAAGAAVAAAAADAAARAAERRAQREWIEKRIGEKLSTKEMGR